MSMIDTLEIDRLSWRSWDDGNTEYRSARAWGYDLSMCDCDGDGVDWAVIHRKTKSLVAHGAFKGDPLTDFDEQFEACEIEATRAAWACAKAQRAAPLSKAEWADNLAMVKT